jgi:hypothetical protein
MWGLRVHDDTRNWCYRRERVFGVVVNSGVMRKGADVAALFPMAPGYLVLLGVLG